ncbi:MAG: 50S ribosomal protein L17 [Desulfobacterales bacterium]|nr:50S ribosomal protein L17 [Desulfobacterales bacterium]
MRHRKAGLKLNRTPSHRNAMFRNMVTSLFKHERIRTTGAKAKELRRWADHVITLAKRGDLHARRQALAIVREKEVVHKLFEQAADRFGAISGGYTRIIKLGMRPGDAAPVSLIELVYSRDTKKKKTKKKKTKADRTPKAAIDRKPAGDEKALAAAEKKKKSAKTKAAPAEKKEATKVEAEASKKKAAAKAKPDTATVKAKPAAAKKTTGDQKEDEAKMDPQPAAKKQPAASVKQAKPEAKKKQDSTTKTTKDEK